MRTLQLRPAISISVAKWFNNRRPLVTAGLMAPLVLVLIFAYILPMAGLVKMSFVSNATFGAPSPDYTWDNYIRFFSDPWFVGTLLRSFRIAVLVTVITVTLAYLIAYWLVFSRPKHIDLLLMAIIAPVLVGNVVRAFGWRFLMGDSGVVNSLLMKLGMSKPLSFMYTEHGIMIADASVLLPLITIILVGVLSRLDPAYLEAAKSLGANGARAFWHVMMPLSLQGIGAASLICFTLAFGTFETAVLIGGGRVQMVAPLVYQQVGLTFDWPFGAAIAFIILAVSIAGIVLHDSVVKEPRP